MLTSGLKTFNLSPRFSVLYSFLSKHKSSHFIISFHYTKQFRVSPTPRLLPLHIQESGRTVFSGTHSCLKKEKRLGRFSFFLSASVEGSTREIFFSTVSLRMISAISNRKPSSNWFKSKRFTVVLEKTLESFLDSKEIKPVNPKGNQPWMFFGSTDTEAEAPILWPPDKSRLIGKYLDSGKDWGQKDNGHEFEQTLEIVEEREAWHTVVHRVTESETRLSNSTRSLRFGRFGTDFKYKNPSIFFALSSSAYWLDP